MNNHNIKQTWETEELNGLDDLIRNWELLAACQIWDMDGFLHTGVGPPYGHVSTDGSRGDGSTPGI